MKALYPELPLPPKPILTRWGTWIEAVSCYAHNIDAIKHVIHEIDSKSKSVKKVKDLLEDESIKNHLTYIFSNFTCLINVIKKLQYDHLPITESIAIIENLKIKLHGVNGYVANSVNTKLNSVLGKNPGYKDICKIKDILISNSNINFEGDHSPQEIAKFNFVPITSYDLERSFSQYKSILRDNRRSFIFDNLKMHFVSYCLFNR